MGKLNEITGRIWEKGKTGDGNVTQEMQDLRDLMLELIEDSFVPFTKDTLVLSGNELRQKVENL